MPAHAFVTVNVFTARRFAGNPLAVFPDACGIDEAAMQAIAAEFNLSETTFVLPPDNPQHHARVRIFTPKAELPFAGHPNVGTGYVLGTRDPKPPEHYVFEEPAGLVRVHLLRDAPGRPVSGARVAAPKALAVTDEIPVETVAACAGLPAEAVATDGHKPLVASVGTEFVIAEVASVEALSQAAPDLAAFRAAARRFSGLGARFALHLYVRVDGDARHLRTRMFAPLSGVLEDPATGSANAALAALLTSLAPGVDVDLTYEIEQGIEMGRPSLILASSRKEVEGPVTASIAGDCVPVMQGTIEV
jgi:trans-2,3-dihydro-3-hydroxyanthranilate isomerase